MYQIFVDTDMDITPIIAKKYGFKLISMPYSMKEDELVFPYEDFDDFEYKSFYDTLRKGVIPKTSALSPEKYMEYFEPTLKEGKDIFYIHFSKAMSGTFNSMKLAFEELSKKYPERKLYTLDTKAITICSYNIICTIGDMLLENPNMSIEEIINWGEKEIDKFAVYFFADSLKFFARSGRVSNFTASMGGFLGIRPLLNMNSEGKMLSIGKVKGRHAAINALINYVTSLQDDILSYRVVIGHTDSFELANELKNLLIEKFSDKLNVEIIVVNPTAGSHCGPDTIGVTFHAIHR